MNELYNALTKFDRICYKIGVKHGQGITNNSPELRTMHHEANQLKALILKLAS